jgi:hypothetical protein
MNHRVIVITGSVGSGKTAVLDETSDLLALNKIPHAAIDLDALGRAFLPQGAPADVIFHNLRAVWQNYVDLGVNRLVVARAVETPEELAQIADAVPGSDLVVCRLAASAATLQDRIRRHDRGIRQPELLSRAAALDRALEEISLEDFVIQTDGRGVTDVARELIGRAEWV